MNLSHDGGAVAAASLAIMRAGVERLRRERSERSRRDAAGFREPAIDRWAFITTERLARDAARLASRVPPGVDLVAAVPRSGLPPGAVVATHLHLPLVACSRQRGVTEVGSGVRLETSDGLADGPPRHVLLVDDTAATGKEIAANAAIVRGRWPGAIVTRAVVYCAPRARPSVDLCAAILEGPHYLEWNWQNAGHGALCGFDFDGVLCTEDGAAAPLYLPRRAAAPLIATGRHESTRAATQSWLDHWGVRVDQLVMRDFDAPEVFDRERIAAFKARHYSASRCELFAESDPWQAERIRDLTGRPVLCPAAERVFPPSTTRPSPPTEDAPPLPSLAAMVAGVASAIARTAARAATHRPVFASGAERARRIEACLACEHYRRVDARCALCGCATARKIALAGESCPVRKWGPESG